MEKKKTELVKKKRKVKKKRTAQLTQEKKKKKKSKRGQKLQLWVPYVCLITILSLNYELWKLKTAKRCF